MDVRRHLAVPLRRSAREGAPLLLQGPRGAGKTALVRRELPSHLYISLDDSADRAFARRHPALFLARLRRPAVIDELQRAPELVSYIKSSPLEFPLVLVSSLRLSLEMETLELYPPTRAERERRPAMPLQLLGRFVPAPARPSLEPQPSQPWPRNRDFLQKDIPLLVQAHEPDLIERLLDLLAARAPAPLHQQALARELGVAHRTVVRWLAALDSCFLTLRLAPLDLPMGRRIVRRPKLHILTAPANFESEVVSEIFRNARHAGMNPVLHYWRDSNGFEIPLIVQTEPGAPPVAAAIAAIPSRPDVERLHRWVQLASAGGAALITRAAASPEFGPERVLRYTLEQL